jgi:hypothetical protein
VQSTCGATTSLLKVEFYADDTKRRSISGFSLKTAGATTYKNISATWGAVGEKTVKATPLNWSKEQADGAQICMEIVGQLDDFCLGAPGLCWANLFDVSKKCCPLYSASVL